MLAQLTHPCLPEKADRENMEKPPRTVNLKAAQGPSSADLRGEKKLCKGHGWQGNAPELLQHYLQISFCI